MVLIGRREYLESLRFDRALNALIIVLFDGANRIEIPDRIRQTADAVVGIMAALQSGEKTGFTRATKMLVGRRIAADSDWIYDDLLAFSLVVGVLRFGEHNDLADQLLRMRMTAGDDHSRAISESLIALLRVGQDAPLSSIIIVGNHLAFPNKVSTVSTLSKAFEQSLKMEMLPSTQQFLRLIGEKVTEMATEMGTQSASDYSLLLRFRKKFDLRARIFSLGVFCLLLISVAALWLAIASLYFSPDKTKEEFAGKLFQMGVVIGPIALFLTRKAVCTWLHKLFYSMFGGNELV